MVIGLGPGFTAGRDVHAVIETARGHDLGRVLFEGEAKSNTGVPGMICGYSIERVIYSPCAGVLHAVKKIGDHVNAGESIAIVEGREICSKIPGTLRGIIRDGFFVTKGLKAADVDPRDTAEYCSTISDKARLIGFGVLQAITMLTKDKGEK